ncbi:cytidine deaminase [Clostridium botulinum]|nr:cytidine deaminase [Clostridium botulinum]
MLDPKDMELIEKASEILKKNYDRENYNHTVAAAVKCSSGNIYLGINVFSLHGACAEQVAIGTAVTNGEKDFKCIVAIRGENGDEVLSPCGNCRQMLSDYCPNCEVIIQTNDGLQKVLAKDLIPFAYKSES